MKRQRKSKTITRTVARRRAGVYLLRSLLKGAIIMDGAKVRCRPSYGAPPLDPANVWLLFLRTNDAQLELRSSELVAVCKRTGRIRYHGSANDEGVSTVALGTTMNPISNYLTDVYDDWQGTVAPLDRAMVTSRSGRDFSAGSAESVIDSTTRSYPSS